MLKELLEQRQLPPILKMRDGSAVTVENWEFRRQELVDILAENIYGKLPKAVTSTIWREVKKDVNAAGKAMTREMEITISLPDGTPFTYPVTVTVPFSARPETPKPAIVFISFGYAKYYPMEELVDQDVIVAEIVMNDISQDKDDGWGSGMAKILYPDGIRKPDSPGKITMWAYAASGVLDYLLSLECVDRTRVAAAGHSRLGKTALWAAANDTRFTHAFSNESGCAGAALTRQKAGETFPDIMMRFPYWFCENMQKHSSCVEDIEKAGFDQHYLLAAIAPRKVYVASAQQDQWADPVSEYLCCKAVSEVWEMLGATGFVAPDRFAEPGDCFAEGNIGYHIRTGTHFLSRHDWIRFCCFLKK